MLTRSDRIDPRRVVDHYLVHDGWASLFPIKFRIPGCRAPVPDNMKAVKRVTAPRQTVRSVYALILKDISISLGLLHPLVVESAAECVSKPAEKASHRLRVDFGYFCDIVVNQVSA